MTPTASAQIVQEQVARISSLTGPELQDWIQKRLEGHDVILEHNEENSPGFAIVALARHLPAIVLSQIHKAIVTLLTKWSSTAERGDSALDNLLLLIQGLKVTEAGDQLVSIVSGECLPRLSDSLQDRAVQTLVALGINLSPEFWYAVFAKNPRHAAGVVFDGLALISPKLAITFLPRIPDDADAVHAIEIGLPGFMDNIGEPKTRAETRGLIELHLPSIKPALAQTLIRFFADEGTPLTIPADIVEFPGEITSPSLSPTRFPMLTKLGVDVNQIRTILAANAPRMFTEFAVE